MIWVYRGVDKEQCLWKVYGVLRFQSLTCKGRKEEGDGGLWWWPNMMRKESGGWVGFYDEEKYGVLSK